MHELCFVEGWGLILTGWWLVDSGLAFLSEHRAWVDVGYKVIETTVGASGIPIDLNATAAGKCEWCDEIGAANSLSGSSNDQDITCVL